MYEIKIGGSMACGGEACNNCGGIQAKHKITTNHSGKSLELCNNCFKKLVDKLQAGKQN